MEDILSLLIVSVFLVTTKGQCLLNVGTKSITTCNYSTAFGPLIYIDFFKIDRPCLCTMTSTFSGDILVTAQETRISSCSTQVVVNGSSIFGCPLLQGRLVTFPVLKYRNIAVQAEFTPPSSSGTFYQCLGFQQNGGKGGDVLVLCNIPSGTTTRRSYTASPTGKTRYPVISSTKKRTSPVTSTTRRATSSLTSTTRKTTFPLTSTTRKTTSPLTPTTRKTTSSLTSTTRKTTFPLTVKTGKTTSPVTSTRKIACPLSTTSKIKLTSTSQSAITANTKTNK